MSNTLSFKPTMDIIIFVVFFLLFLWKGMRCPDKIIWCLLGWLVGFLTSSSTTRLYRGRAPRQSVWQFYVLPHMRQSWETMTSVSAGHIILTPTQPATMQKYYPAAQIISSLQLQWMAKLVSLGLDDMLYILCFPLIGTKKRISTSYRWRFCVCLGAEPK